MTAGGDWGLCQPLFFLSFNHPQSLNNVGEGFRVLAAHIGKLLVLAFAYICLKVGFGIFYGSEGLAGEHTSCGNSGKNGFC